MNDRTQEQKGRAVVDALIADLRSLSAKLDIPGAKYDDAFCRSIAELKDQRGAIPLGPPTKGGQVSS
jgi:hypothetical protein